MHKPKRKVMSMVPNQKYLHGYNDCVEETTAYCAKLEDLLRQLLKAHNHDDNLELMYPELKAEVVKVLGGTS